MTGALSVPRTVWAPEFSSKQEAMDAQALSVPQPRAAQMQNLCSL